MREEEAWRLLEEQRAALLSGDLRRFLDTFVLEGHDEPALTAWFCGYTTDPPPSRVQVAIDEISGEGVDGRLRASFTLSWPGFDDVTERADYQVSWLESGTRQRVKLFLFRRDLPPWPDSPSREPVVLAPAGVSTGGASARTPARPWPALSPVVSGAIAPPGEWGELGACVLRLRVSAKKPRAPRLEVVGRDPDQLSAALPFAVSWLSRRLQQGQEAQPWTPAPVPGAPGWNNWRRISSLGEPDLPHGAGLDPAARFADPVPLKLLERTIDRLVRYREAHPELGQASILAEMMSTTTARWAYQLSAADPAGVLEGLSRRFSRRVAAGEHFPRPPEVPRSQRRPLPWGGLDEALAIKGSYGQSRAPCGTLGPVYAAVMRLSGCDPFTAYTVQMPARLVAVIHLERATYLVSNHGVVPMLPTTRYWARTVHRLFTDAWFWDESGATDAPPEAIERHRETLARRLPSFPAFSRVAPAESPATGFWQGSTAEHPAPRSLAAAVRRYVEAESLRRPPSPYTWARYAFQTLRVAHPQVYLRCALNGRDVEETAKAISSRDDLLRWAEGLKRRSMFPERDRLMTPDQVIRYRRGRPADIAGALAAVLWRRFGGRPLVQLRGGSAYVLWEDDGRRWLKVDDLTLTRSPWGELEAAWDAEAGWTRWSALPLPQALVLD
ncbi:MAG: hypothetical protein K6T75_00095 [Acetobacteraceae bacterium]|nr:hypothetical protein [Acetobacteraceae bacterium]